LRVAIEAEFATGPIHILRAQLYTVAPQNVCRSRAEHGQHVNPPPEAAAHHIGHREPPVLARRSEYLQIRALRRQIWRRKFGDTCLRQQKRGFAMLDRTTKLLLGAIAIGIWVNISMVLLKPTAAVAQAGAASALSGQLGAISSYLAAIANGTCKNRKICGH
jgi:hypothetical protein